MGENQPMGRSLKTAHQRWLRVEAFYKEYRLACEISAAVVTVAAIAAWGYVGGLDPPVLTVLVMGLVVLAVTALRAFRGLATWAGALICVAVIAAVLLVQPANETVTTNLLPAGAPEPASAEVDEQPTNNQLAAASQEFRADLLELVRARVEPAYAATNEPFWALSGWVESTNGLVTRLAREHPHAEMMASWEALNAALEDQSTSAETLQNTFCLFFENYQELVLLTRDLGLSLREQGKLTWNFEDRFYVQWLREDDRLRDGLRDFMADSRYADISACVTRIGFREDQRVR
jgi:hypothetical protein